MTAVRASDATAIEAMSNASPVTTTLAVSVVIPTYNRAHLLPNALRSVLAATRQGDEVIVVDDGSTDDTEGALAPWRERIQYIRVPNGGAGAARNRGVRLATKPLVAFLDSDDEWLPDKLELQRALMSARPDVLFCFSDFSMRDAAGIEHHRYLRKWPGVSADVGDMVGPGIPYSSVAPLPKEREDFLVHIGDLYLPLLESCLVATQSAMVRRVEGGSELHFGENVKLCEEWWCFAALARKGRAAYMDCETFRNVGHTGDRITATESEHRMLSDRLTMTTSLWGLDQEFLRHHRSRYGAVLRSLYLRRARWLLSRGRSAEARADLRRAGSPPLGLRALSLFPPSVVRRLGELRRRLHS
jgi:glycosyltransferase involved in cell wall biosynthesis